MAAEFHATVRELISGYDPLLLAALGAAALPTGWNIVARSEYRTHWLTKVCCGSKYIGCYVLAFWIFMSSIVRDWLFTEAVLRAPGAAIVAAEHATALYWFGASLLVFGMCLVLTSFYRLGVTGTYLGDYFGILMSHKVTAFPFSTFENPMYLGATCNFLGVAFEQNSWNGVFLAAWIYVVYEVATRLFENPFTDMIYREAAKKAAKKTKQ